MFIDIIGNAQKAELVGYNEREKDGYKSTNQPEIKSVDIADGYNLIGCALYSPLSHLPFSHLFPTFLFFIFQFYCSLYFPIL